MKPGDPRFSAADSRYPPGRHGRADDVDPDCQMRLPPARGSNPWIAMSCATLIMLAVSALIRTFPTEGYRAGYDAAISGGTVWVPAEADARTALRGCEELFRRTVLTEDYGDFIDGCGAALDALSGRHVLLVEAD